MVEIKIRAIVGIMIFFGYFVMYVVRYSISVHIVDMTSWMYKEGHKNNDALTTERGDAPDYLPEVLNASGTRSIAIVSSKPIHWDDLKISKLFCAYHIGYCICFPIFHNIGDGLGPTWVVSIAGVISGVLNCLTPAATSCDFWMVFLVRILTGFCAGAMHPSMVQVLRHWVPPMERNHFMWAYCGVTLGTFSTFLICTAVQYYSRWPLGFYISGGVQIIWAGLWIVLVTDYPSNHPFISSQEETYLNHTIGTIFTIKLTNSQAPWLSILRSVPFWALCTLNFGYAWLIIGMSLHGPIYYARVLDYSIHTASVLTSIPFLLRLIFGTLLIHLFHWYQHNTNISRIPYLRKYTIVVSHLAPGFLLASMWLSYVIPGPILLTTALLLTSAGMDLTLDLCYELSPNFFNYINTVVKMIGNTPGIILPLIVGQFTYWLSNTPDVWKHIWCCNGVVILISGLVFLAWGETSIQPWNTIDERFRPRRQMVPPIRVRPSVMSDIVEVEEEESLNNTPASQQTLKKNSRFSRPFLKM